MFTGRGLCLCTVAVLGIVVSGLSSPLPELQDDKDEFVSLVEDTTNHWVMRDAARGGGFGASGALPPDLDKIKLASKAVGPSLLALLKQDDVQWQQLDTAADDIAELSGEVQDIRRRLAATNQRSLQNRGRLNTQNNRIFTLQRGVAGNNLAVRTLSKFNAEVQRTLVGMRRDIADIKSFLEAAQFDGITLEQDGLSITTPTNAQWHIFSDGLDLVINYEDDEIMRFTPVADV
ncbi:unnamed protein product [Chrysoparadoxa australica]